MSVVSLSMEGAQGIAASLGQISQSVEQLAQRQAANTRATVAGAAASRGFAQTAQQGAERVASLASSVQGLVSQLGVESRTGSLVASMAGTVAQGIAFGTAFGPGGVVVGAVVATVAGMGSLARAGMEAREALAALNATSIEVATTLHRTMADDPTGDSWHAGIVAAQTQVETLNERANELREIAGSAMRGMLDPLAVGAARAELADVESQIRSLNRTISEASDAAEAAGPGSSATAGGMGTGMSSFLSMDAGLARLGAGRARGAGGGDNGAAGGRASAEAADEWARAVAEAENAAAAARAAGDRERADAHDAAVAAMMEANTAANAAMATEAREAEAEKTSLVRAADEERMSDRRDAMAELEDFTRGEVGSLQSVIDAYRELQLTAKGTGVQVRDTGLLMSRSMTATGNTILDSVGNKMTGAFQEAVGAWLDGSKSFVEAAEGMAKGVIKALVMEGIVQAVVEGARSIASFASQDYAGGVAHAGAAAAWAAVAVVAGGVGAATGAFGGGGAKTEGASQRDMASADRERQRGGEPGTTVINVYADNLPVTQGDLDRVMTQMVRRGIERHGERFPGLSR